MNIYDFWFFCFSSFPHIFSFSAYWEIHENGYFFKKITHKFKKVLKLIFTQLGSTACNCPNQSMCSIIFQDLEKFSCHTCKTISQNFTLFVVSKCMTELIWLYSIDYLRERQNGKQWKKQFTFKKIKYYCWIHTIWQNKYLKFSNLENVLWLNHRTWCGQNCKVDCPASYDLPVVKLVRLSWVCSGLV